MKRLIAAVSFAILATPALAQGGKPYEQLDVDRALPNISVPAASETRYPFNGSAPYEQLAVDRALPNLNVGEERNQFAASSGDTRSDRDIAVEAEEVESTGTSGLATGPWANDHNFIAPAQ